MLNVKKKKKKKILSTENSQTHHFSMVHLLMFEIINFIFCYSTFPGNVYGLQNIPVVLIISDITINKVINCTFPIIDDDTPVQINWLNVSPRPMRLRQRVSIRGGFKVTGNAGSRYRLNLTVKRNGRRVKCSEVRW